MMWQQVLFGSILSGLYYLFCTKQTYLNISGAIIGYLVLISSWISGIHFFVVIVACAGLSIIKFDSQKSKEKASWKQVLAANVTGTIIALSFNICVVRSLIPLNIAYYQRASFLFAAFVGHYASYTGITWASQVTSLSPSSSSFLITSLRRVPRGTKGAVSIFGCVASIFGGFFVSVAFFTADVIERHVMGAAYLARPSLFPFLALGILCGLLGYIVDALIGATLQFSGWSDSKRAVVNSPGAYVKPITGINMLGNSGVLFLATLATCLWGGLLSRLLPLLELKK